MHRRQKSFGRFARIRPKLQESQAIGNKSRIRKKGINSDSHRNRLPGQSGTGRNVFFFFLFFFFHVPRYFGRLLGFFQAGTATLYRQSNNHLSEQNFSQLPSAFTRLLPRSGSAPPAFSARAAAPSRSAPARRPHPRLCAAATPQYRGCPPSCRAGPASA